MYETLTRIGRLLNEKKVLWGVGASVLLHQYGLVDSPKDIDLLAALEDVDAIDGILQGVGEKKDREKAGLYSTRVFREYVVGGVDIDVMAGFSIRHTDGVFAYVFDRKSITRFIEIKGVEIPFTSLEDWYVLYQLIPGRKRKVELIESHLRTNGIQHPFLLERALKGDLPGPVAERVRGMLGFYGL